MKNRQSTTKPIKIGKKSGTTYGLGCKDYTYNFRPQKVKIKYSEKISLCCLSIKYVKIFEAKNKLTTNVIKIR